MNRTFALTGFMEKMQEYDKKQHFCYSFVILLSTLLFFSWETGIILTAVIGLIKEIWDHYYGSGFCWYDMAANGLGMTTASLVVSPLLMH